MVEEESGIEKYVDLIIFSTIYGLLAVSMTRQVLCSSAKIIGNFLRYTKPSIIYMYI